MLVRGIVDEDFVNYKEPCMFISTAFCTFKCEQESGIKCCQNHGLSDSTIINVKIGETVDRYISNPITKAVCFGGLEPIEQFDDVMDFIAKLRSRDCNDTVIIYTGFYKNEIEPQIEALGKFPNIIVKFGRYVPNQGSHRDELLGVNLASPNQYAEVIS